MITDLLKNLTLSVDGYGYAGRVEDLTPPKLTVKTEDYRAGGMDAPVKIDMGMEEMEATFTLTAFDAEVLARFGLAPGNLVPLTFRGAVESEDGTVTPVVVNLSGSLTELDPGTWKAGDLAKLKGTVAVRYYKLTHGGRVVHEIDVENMVRMIDGVDRLASTRAALGI